MASLIQHVNEKLFLFSAEEQSGEMNADFSGSKIINLPYAKEGGKITAPLGCKVGADFGMQGLFKLSE